MNITYYNHWSFDLEKRWLWKQHFFGSENQQSDSFFLNIWLQWSPLESDITLHCLSLALPSINLAIIRSKTSFPNTAFMDSMLNQDCDIWGRKRGLSQVDLNHSFVSWIRMIIRIRMTYELKASGDWYLCFWTNPDDQNSLWFIHLHSSHAWAWDLISGSSFAPT